MSGGSFNYAYSRVNEFADDLEHKLNIAGEVIKDYSFFGSEPCREPEWDDETNRRLRYIVDQARKFAEVMRAVEWLYSYDSGPDYVKQALEKHHDPCIFTCRPRLLPAGDPLRSGAV